MAWLTAPNPFLSGVKAAPTPFAISPPKSKDPTGAGNVAGSTSTVAPFSGSRDICSPEPRATSDEPEEDGGTGGTSSPQGMSESPLRQDEDDVEVDQHLMIYREAHAIVEMITRCDYRGRGVGEHVLSSLPPPPLSLLRLLQQSRQQALMYGEDIQRATVAAEEKEGVQKIFIQSSTLRIMGFTHSETMKRLELTKRLLQQHFELFPAAGVNFSCPVEGMIILFQKRLRSCTMQMTWHDELRPLCKLIGVRSVVGGWDGRTTEDVRRGFLQRMSRLHIPELLGPRGALALVATYCRGCPQVQWCVQWLVEHPKWEKRERRAQYFSALVGMRCASGGPSDLSVPWEVLGNIVRWL